jgi:hypothetical protein
MIAGVSKFVNIGWLINLLLTGFAPLLILKNTLQFLVFAIAAALPLVWLAISLIF